MGELRENQELETIAQKMDEEQKNSANEQKFAHKEEYKDSLMSQRARQENERKSREQAMEEAQAAQREIDRRNKDEKDEYKRKQMDLKQQLLRQAEQEKTKRLQDKREQHGWAPHDGEMEIQTCSEFYNSKKEVDNHNKNSLIQKESDNKLSLHKKRQEEEDMVQNAKKQVNAKYLLNNT